MEEKDIIKKYPNVEIRRNKFITELKYDLNRSKSGDSDHKLISTYIKEYLRILHEESLKKKFELDEMDLWGFIK